VSYIAIPILFDDKPIGVLAVHRLRNRQRQFKSDLNVLRITAAMIAQVLRVNELVAEKTAHLMSENRYLKNVLDTQGTAYGIIGESQSLRRVLKQANQVADTQATVMLTGESGTGKEKFARMIHLISERRDKPFICINCAAIPETLLESELFGHEKGSFTGATRSKPGKIELANHGTLFLDEIGDMPLELQSKLLRVLQERVIQRVGGSAEIPVDVRIITATHKNLQESVNDGSFRLDLYYRLNVIPIALPALRERSGDIKILARHFINVMNHKYGRNMVFDDDALERLEIFDWPGNIRQLENVIERSVLMSSSNRLTMQDIDAVLADEASVKPVSAAVLESIPIQKEEIMNATSSYGNNLNVRPYLKVRGDEKQTILDALQRCGNNKTRAALSLNMTPRQLRYRINKLGISL
jgi:Nif-specific regulatory protein